MVAQRNGQIHIPLRAEVLSSHSGGSRFAIVLQGYSGAAPGFGQAPGSGFGPAFRSSWGFAVGFRLAIARLSGALAALKSVAVFACSK